MRRARATILVLALCAGACRRVPPSGTAPESSASTAPPPPTASAVPADGTASTAPPSASAAVAAPSTTARRREPDVPTVSPRALLGALPSPGEHPSAGFAGPVDPSLDAAWVTRLATAKLEAVAWNGGGVTLTFKARFADGRRALFKPEQSRSGSNHRAEIAAYHLDRLLGLGRVAVVVGRALPASWLRDAVTDPALAARVERELTVTDGRVVGAMIAWHSAPLFPAEPRRGWRASLSGDGPVDPELRARAAELGDLALFDFLQDNTDRWSGGNVLSLGKGGPLVFLDNASSLLPSRARHGASLERELTPLCRLRRRTVDALSAPRDLAAELAASVARDPSGATLEPLVVDALRARVARAREHVARCRRERGDAVWLDD